MNDNKTPGKGTVHLWHAAKLILRRQGEMFIQNMFELVVLPLCVLLLPIVIPHSIWQRSASKRRRAWANAKRRIYNASWLLRHWRTGVQKRYTPIERALGQAALSRNAHNVEVLLRRGANPNLLLKYDWPLLTIIAERGHTEIVQLMLDAGADIEAAHPMYRFTALRCAAKNGHHETVALLLQRGADPQSKSSSGATPAIAATIAGHAETVRLLIEAIREQENFHSQGRTLMQIARRRRHPEIVRLLQEAGVNETRSQEEVTLLRPASAPCALPALQTLRSPH